MLLQLRGPESLPRSLRHHVQALGISFNFGFSFSHVHNEGIGLGIDFRLNKTVSRL